MYMAIIKVNSDNFENVITIK